MGRHRRKLASAAKSAAAKLAAVCETVAVQSQTPNDPSSVESISSTEEQKAFVLKSTMEVCLQLGIQPPLTIFKHGANGEGICESYWESEQALFTAFADCLTGHETASADEKCAIVARANADGCSCQIESGEPTRVIEKYPVYDEMIETMYLFYLNLDDEETEEPSASDADLQEIPAADADQQAIATANANLQEIAAVTAHLQNVAVANANMQMTMQIHNAHLQASQAQFLRIEQQLGQAPTHYENGVPHYSNLMSSAVDAFP